MSYGLIYTVPFAALDNTPCVVEIEKEGYEGEVTELVAGETPFTVDIDDEEFLYTPTRFSTAKLSIVGGDYLQNLFATDYRQIRVTFKYDGAVAWCGYVKPEVYTQDYTAERFEFSLECVSAFSVLENIDYTLEGSRPVFVSFWTLLKKCLAAAGGNYTGVYIPDVYATDSQAYESGTANVLEQMTVSEQNFFDEEGEPMTLLEVLEEVCKFLNWTCADWTGAVCLVDVDASRYRLYGTDMTTGTLVSPAAGLSAQEIGFAGTGHSLDILPGYNKVTVKCSNYAVGQSADAFDPDELPEMTTGDLYDDNDVCHRIYLNPTGTELITYTIDADGNPQRKTDFSDVYTDEEANALFGALPMQYCNYQMEHDYVADEWKPNITDYSYTNVISARCMGPGNEQRLPWYTPLFAIRMPCAIYAQGVISISGSVKFCKDAEMSPLVETDYGELYNELLIVQLRIGNKWYDGTTWQDEETHFSIKILVDDGTDFLPIPDDKLPSQPYTGAQGYLAYLPSVLEGELELTVLSRNVYAEGTPVSEMTEYGYLIQDLKIEFVPQDDKTRVDGDDRIYESVVNEDYISELDEIEFKISSWNNDGTCYSKVMLDGDLLSDNLYNVLLGKNKRPEELLITRVINHYSAPLVKLTQPLAYRPDMPVTPIDRLTDTFQPGKQFINAGGTIDYRMNVFECIMIEI